MLQCSEVTKLVASDTGRKPPLRRRLGVLLHLAVCRHCRAYSRQLRRIGDAVRGLYGRTTVDPDGAARVVAAVREAAERGQPPGPTDRD
ncbi:MAG TPA: hypothetical protein VGA37_14765 [Gemmatimonadales bacterium]